MFVCLAIFIANAQYCGALKCLFSCSCEKWSRSDASMKSCEKISKVLKLKNVFKRLSVSVVEIFKKDYFCTVSAAFPDTECGESVCGSVMSVNDGTCYWLRTLHYNGGEIAYEKFILLVRFYNLFWRLFHKTLKYSFYETCLWIINGIITLTYGKLLKN